MKGQYVGMVTLFVFLFIISGNIFGALLFQEEYSERAEISVGGVNTIAEAQIRGKLYNSRMQKELNYSSNIIALQQGEREREWSSAPAHQQVLDNYLNTVAGEVRSQSGIVKCNPPEIGSVSVEGNNSYTATFSDPYISCSTEGTESRIKMSEEQIEAENTNNSYVQLSEVGVELGEHIDSQDLPENWEGEGSSGESCGPSVDRSSNDESAKAEARNNAIEDSDLANTVIGEFSEPEWVEIDTDEVFDVSYSVESRDYDPSCTYESTCQTGVDEDGDPVYESCDKTGESYDVTYSAEVTEARLKYDLADRKKINRYKDPREAVKNDEIGFNDFDLRVPDEERDEDTYREPREVFDDWVEGELSTEEADDETQRSFDIPWDKIQRERKVLDSNAVLQTLHFKFDYIHSMS